MHKLSKALTFIGALLALAFCAVSCKTDDDDEPTMYTVTVSDSLEHGKVTADKSSAEAGATVKLTATADSGYELDSYSVKDEKSNTITVTEGTFTMPKSNVTVSATFKEIAVTPQKTAGSISYATTSVEKTTAAEAFTNALTKTGNGTVSYTSDNTAVATVNEDGEVTIKGAGTATITATVADSDTYTYATKTASYTLTVTQAVTYIGTKAPTEAKAVGDIVFSDGSATPYSTDLTLSGAQKEAAVAVIYYAGSAEDVLGAKTLGVGLKNTGADNTLAWSMNADTDITAIQCKPSGEEAATAKFTGDTDGSDNWQALCDKVSDEDTSGNYPAWEWVNAYATTAKLTGDYASGWYLPTVAELSMLYRAKDTVNSALEKAGGMEIADAVYWSSSQVASSDYAAWNVWFADGTLDFSGKYNNNSVCAVRAFSCVDAPKATAIGIKSKPDAVGDIVFNDGSATPYTSELTLTEEQKSKAVAVIFYAGSASDTLGAKTLGVGLVQGTGLAWARYVSDSDKADGYSNSIAGLVCTPSAFGPGKAGNTTVTFTGTTDGRDSLTTLKKDITDYSATNYPAWDFVENYATTAGLTGTYADGWYMPSIAELCKLYQAKTDVNKALSKITGATQMSTSNWYCSSSQIASSSMGAWTVDFGSGYLSHYGSYNTYSVCAVWAFN